MGGCVALVVAGGRGRRFGGDLPKQYCTLGGVAVIRHSLERFLAHPGVDAVQPVIHPDDSDLFAEAARGLDALLSPVHGGTTRQDSVRNGLEAVAAREPDTVLIHDAARPFIAAEVISGVIAALDDHVGAIPALPVADTLKRGGDGLIGDTVDREGLYRAQTPQGFRFQDILAAHRDMAGQELTDDAALAEAAGHSVALVPGSEENQKVTTTEDLSRAERLIPRETRIGTGFDVHAIEPGDHVILCGVEIASEFGLKGHSDADVAMHAVTDALMGAVNAGDIGQHFPPSDPQWKGAASEVFLRKAGELVAEAGGRIVNLDVTVICERPKVGPHREAMAANLARILGLGAERVSVKATTTEKLGFTGRGEGIAAQASASVEVVGSVEVAGTV